MMYLQASALLALAASASAHMFISKPVPFAWENSDTKRSPLEPADFPCKQASGKYAVTTMNQYKAGESMEVKIQGGATHGGGSCQFSITTDTKPNKDTQWKVLFSQIGGCPGGPPGDNKDITSPGAGDLDNDPFYVKLPEDLPSGKYTFAWSWNNKLGNREFYMNCAPLEITGGSGDVSKVLGSLPDMFVANLPATECSLAAGQDALYPNPGKAVATAPAAKPGLQLDGAGCGKQTKLGAGAGKLGAPAAPTGAPGGGKPASTLQTSAAPAAPTGAPGGGKPASSLKNSAAPRPTGSGPVLAPGASSAVAPAPADPKPTGSTGDSSDSDDASPSGAAPSGGASPAPGSSPAGCTPCTNDGGVVCIGDSAFGLCDRGCAVSMPLAAGVKCANGQITRRSTFGSWFN